MKPIIVIQGKIEGQRTEDIVNLVLSVNPETDVILSTWYNFNCEYFNRLTETQPRFKLVQSHFPTCPGWQNRHYQRVSTFAGVELAVVMGATHILKMRTDQPLRRPTICNFLASHLDRFGNDRLVIGRAITTPDERCGRFHIGDWWMFGRTHHFQDWYDTKDIDMRSDFFQHIPAGAHGPCAESDFAQVWLQRIKFVPQSFENLIAEKFVILDTEEVDAIYKTNAVHAPKESLADFWSKFETYRTVGYEGWLKIYNSEHRVTADNVSIDSK